MDRALFEKALQQASLNAENVYFHILGEPTLHPNFITYLDSLKKTSLKLNLTTNGTTISAIQEILLNSDSIRQINFSTHAYAELPQNIAEKHLQNVLEFSQSAIEKRPDLYINLRLWNVGDNQSKEWNDFMLQEINKFFMVNVVPGNFCSRHKSFQIKERLYLHEDSRFEWPSLNQDKNPINKKGTCRALDTHVGILSNGTVVACCLDYKGTISLGNIQEQSLDEILHSELAQKLKAGFEAKELRHPLCQNCQFCKRFK